MLCCCTVKPEMEHHGFYFLQRGLIFTGWGLPVALIILKEFSD